MKFLLFFQLFSPVDPEVMANLHLQRITRLTEQHGATSPQVREAQKELGLFWMRNSQPGKAEPWLRMAQSDAAVLPFLAESLAAQRRDAEAEAVFAQCAATSARCHTRLAQYAERRGDVPAAIGHYRAALAAEPNGVRRNDLALALRAANQNKEAEQQFRTALAEQEKSLGPQHPETASTRNNLASLLTAAERYVEAEPLQRQALSAMERTLGPRHMRTGLSASNLADILRARGKETEARKLYQRALEIFRESLPAGHPWIGEAEEALR